MHLSRSRRRPLAGPATLAAVALTLLFAAPVFSAEASSANAANAAPAAPTTPPTLEEIFRPAAARHVQLSPNGAYLGLIATDQKDSRILQIVDIAKHTTTSLSLGPKVDVSWFNWVSDNHLMFGAQADKSESRGISVVKRDQLNRSWGIVLPTQAVQIIGVPTARRDRALAWLLNEKRNPEFPGSLVELATLHPNAKQGSDMVPALTYPMPPHGIVAGWGRDRDGELCLAATYEGGTDHLSRYDAKSKTWTPVDLDLELYGDLGMDFDGHSLWTSHHDPARGFVLCKYDLDTGKFDEPVLSDKAYDLRHARTYYSRSTRQLAGLSYHQRRLKNVWFVPAFGQAQAAIDQANPNTDNQLVSHDEKDSRFVFLCSSGRDPGSYLLYDAATKAISRLSKVAPWLDGKALATPQPISFRSRDGLALEGYLTLPAGASKDHPVPLIVRAHDEPWRRTSWAFDEQVQYFVSRGYAVLQPNYRGSIGYLPTVSRGPRYDFRHMSDDLGDAVRAVLGSGLVDSQRVAIMGEGFGGYLALSGVTFDPSLYRCAICTEGVFDWDLWLKNTRAYSTVSYSRRVRDWIGQDSAKIDAMSPAKHVTDIKVPLFVSTSRADVEIESHQTRALVDELKRTGRTYETFYLDSVSKGFATLANQNEYHRRIEAFLQKTFATPLAPAP